VLLGAHPPEATGRAIVTWGGRLEISEAAVRMALTRMVAAGDLERHASVYRLSRRLLERQARQDAAIEQRPLAWDGTWYVAVVTAVGADPATRADVRLRMTTDRFAEIREGVWTRPANLDWTPHDGLAPSLEILSATPSRPAAELARSLFDIDQWATVAHELTTALSTTNELATRIAIAASIVRHIVADPLLPAELLPQDWPGQELRNTYQAFRGELLALAQGQGDDDQAARRSV
jgi:phenylacetic acid degradation operon negative regulatory protein